MLIKFQSEGTAPFEMFQEHASQLIALMGQGNQTQGAISGSAVAAVLDRLEAGLANSPAVQGAADTDDGEEDEPAVSASARALPLRAMLKHAIANDSFVMWQPS